MNRRTDKRSPSPTRIGFRSVLRRPAVQVLLLSHILSRTGNTTLNYAAMVHLARIGAAQIEISLLSASGALAALIFGLRGGAVADSLPRRVALALGYGAQAAICFAIPRYVGTGILPLFLLIFSINILSQITTPAIKVAVAVVASNAELATVTVLLALAGGIATATGSALFAPLLLHRWDIRTVIYAAGVLFLFASYRAIAVGERRRAKGRRDADRPHLGGFREMGSWMLEHRGVSTMILVGAAVTVLSRVFDSLQPVYVRSTLGADPAHAIYIFAPGAIGALIGQLLAPLFIRWPGERALAVISLGLFSLAMILFGLISQIAAVIAPFSPLHLLERFGFEPGPRVMAAGMIAILVEFGSASASVAVQTYINRRVPVDVQGTTFGAQSFISNGLGFAGTLTVGALATVFGTRVIFLLLPSLLAIGLVLLIRSSYRATDEPVPTPREALATLWAEPVDPALRSFSDVPNRDE